MKNLLTGSLIGAVVAAVVGGTVWSATSLMYLTGAVPTVGHILTFADTNGGVVDGGPAGAAPTRPFSLTWGPGQNLSAATLPMGVSTNAATVVSAWCAVGALNGAGTLALWYAASGTALGSGTQINVPAQNCNANTGVNATQNMGVGASPANAIPAGAVFGVVATGFSTTGTGSGVVHIVLQ
jgi:hypothetical protein